MRWEVGKFAWMDWRRLVEKRMLAVVCKRVENAGKGDGFGTCCRDCCRSLDRNDMMRCSSTESGTNPDTSECL